MKRQDRQFTAFTLYLSGLFFILFSGAYSEGLDYSIRLASGEFTPTPNRLTSSALANSRNHFFVQFDHPLSEQERANLEASGLSLIEYLPNLAYIARLDKTATIDQIDNYGIRWIGSPTVEQKLARVFSTDGIPAWTRRGGILIQVTVALHRDEQISNWIATQASSLEAIILGSQTISNAVELLIPESRLYELASMDAVSFVEPALPPQQEHNNGCRSAIKVDSAQATPYNLTGGGVVAAMWDGGRADNSHTDFGSRVIPTDESAVTTHATHVAGTIVGSGLQSSGTYKGMATSAQLLTHLWWNTSSELVAQYMDAVGSNGAEVSNNSWGIGVPAPVTNSGCAATLGNYIIEDITLDEIVRGAAGAPISIVWSAGNMRSISSQYCGSIGWTYNTIDPLASSKNVIAVGAVISNDNSMSTFSSWGPTDDGRIKPDICAPGCQIGGDNGVTSTKPTSGYTTMCGTSMAAPVVTGVIALMKQRWNQLLPSDVLLPSTIKGILINSASDRGNIGPDFQYGWGVIDALAAVKKISVGAPSYVEASIITGATHQYALTIPPGSVKLRATLVWDDVGGTAMSGNALINDLDLILVDPSSSTILPWVLTPGTPGAAATHGVDRKNNVEAVEVDSPASGVWFARVTGYNIPTGPQKYSLVFTPDNSNTTDTARAVDARKSADTSAIPGQSVSVKFLVKNIGGGYDSVHIRMTDSLGWLNTPLDTVLWMGVLDSVWLSRQVTVPSAALPGTATKVKFLVNSRSDTLAADSVNATVTARALCAISIQPIPIDTVGSPDSIQIVTWVRNSGNVNNNIHITVVNDSGWGLIPSSVDTLLVAGDSARITATLTIPASVPHSIISQTTILAMGDSGSNASSVASVFVSNPLPPPSLLLPYPAVFITNRTPSFIWSASGNTFRLVVGLDSNLQILIRNYPAITDTTFVLPTADSLADGVYYWGVKGYSVTDSTSFQRTPRMIVVDNLPPSNVSPVSPVAGQYPNHQHFTCSLSVSAPANPVVSPEFNIIELSADPSFGGIFKTYRPVISDALTIPDSIAEGRWYWRAIRVDSAGNSSALSAVASFVFDTTPPPIPTAIRPQDTALAVVIRGWFLVGQKLPNSRTRVLLIFIAFRFHPILLSAVSYLIHWFSSTHSRLIALFLLLAIRFTGVCKGLTQLAGHRRSASYAIFALLLMSAVIWIGQELRISRI